MAGAVQSDSISGLVSHLIESEFLALNEACERLAGSGKQCSGVERRTRLVERRRQADPNRSIETLLAEFEVVRSAIIRLVEQGAGKNAHYGTLAEVCVARFNVHIEQIERWRDSQLVGFGAIRLRAEALEPELNAAILEIGKEDFLLENFDLQSLFSESLNRYYSDEVVLWLGTELTNGKQAAFQRLADVLEPVHTVLEMGVGCVDVFRVVSSFQDSQGDLVSECEAVSGGSLLDRGCHSLAHGPCLETTGRHRRTNRRPGVGGRSFRCEGSRAAQKLLTLPSHGFKYMV